MERLIVRNVCRIHKGRILLNHIDMDLFSKRIYGIVGRRGSGKTILLKCICGFSPVDNGMVIQDGKRIGLETEFIKDAGFVIGDPIWQPRKTGFENLRCLAMIHNTADNEQIQKCMRRVGLSVELDRPVRSYSLGMRQRLGVAQAIMENPSFILLDEPMKGLDDQDVKKMCRLLGELREEGKTLLVTTCNWEDITLICDNTYVMNSGQLMKTERTKFYH